MSINLCVRVFTRMYVLFPPMCFEVSQARLWRESLWLAGRKSSTLVDDGGWSVFESDSKDELKMYCSCSSFPASTMITRT